VLATASEFDGFVVAVFDELVDAVEVAIGLAVAAGAGDEDSAFVEDEDVVGAAVLVVEAFAVVTAATVTAVATLFVAAGLATFWAAAEVWTCAAAGALLLLPDAPPPILAMGAPLPEAPPKVLLELAAFGVAAIGDGLVTGPGSLLPRSSSDNNVGSKFLESGAIPIGESPSSQARFVAAGAGELVALFDAAALTTLRTPSKFSAAGGLAT
jgi:hypothetical protein